jgi:TolB protein
MKRSLEVLAICCLFLTVREASAFLSVSSPFQISTSQYNQYVPDVSGDLVVWQDDRGFGTGTGWDIYGTNLKTGKEFLVTDAAGDQFDPVINGNVVVWSDRRSGSFDIWAKDLSSGIEFPVCTASGDQLRPQIDGDLVVWMDNRNRSEDIYGYDLRTKTEFPITTAAGDQFRPSISGDRVIWVDSRNIGVQGVDLATNQQYAINNTYPADFTGPYIDGSNVVWMGERNGVFGIYRTDLNSGNEFLVRAQSETPKTVQQPVIEGDLVMWAEGDGGDLNLFDIYGKDTKGGATFPINNDKRGQFNPAINNGLVVWTDTRLGNSHIFGARIVSEPTSSTLALVALCMLAGKRRFA